MQNLHGPFTSLDELLIIKIKRTDCNRRNQSFLNEVAKQLEVTLTSCFATIGYSVFSVT